MIIYLNTDNNLVFMYVRLCSFAKIFLQIAKAFPLIYMILNTNYTTRLSMISKLRLLHY